jgi:hypothetical protein
MEEKRAPCEECSYKEVLAHCSSPVERRERLWSVKPRERKKRDFHLGVSAGRKTTKFGYSLRLWVST